MLPNRVCSIDVENDIVKECKEEKIIDLKVEKEAKQMYDILENTCISRFSKPYQFVKRLNSLERSSACVGDEMALLFIYEAGRINGIREERSRRKARQRV